VTVGELWDILHFDQMLVDYQQRCRDVPGQMNLTVKELRERLKSKDRDALAGLERQLRTPLGEIPFLEAGKPAEGSTQQVTAAVNAVAPEIRDEWERKVLASVPQGQELNAFAKRHGIFDSMNEPFQPLILFKENQRPAMVSGLSLMVLCPFADELEVLRKKWKQLRKKGITAAFKDASPYNLSSIVVLAEDEGKKAILTGGARGDKVLSALQQKNLLKEGKFHVDLLKLPHHGSQNNVTAEFFGQLTADVYVVSGDHDKFPNPNEKAMKWLADARGRDPYVVYCTYDLPYMLKIFKEKLRVPKKDEISISANI
jgi:hypothetical protein